MDKLHQLIQEKMDALPSHIQESLAKINWEQEIISIGQKHGLHIDEMGTLQTETILVLVGLAHPDQYPNNLKKDLHLSTEKIDSIVADVNEKVFKNVRKELIMYLTSEEINNSPKTETEEDDALFQKTGIEIAGEKPQQENNNLSTNISVAPGERSVLKNTGIMLENDLRINEDEPELNRDELLSSLENPIKSKPNDFSGLIKSKLSDSVVNPLEKVKYEDKETPDMPPKKIVDDPYREKI